MIFALFFAKEFTVLVARVANATSATNTVKTILEVVNPTASLRTNMRSTDESKRTTRTQESKSKWEHVLNTNPETMFRKQK